MCGRCGERLLERVFRQIERIGCQRAVIALGLPADRLPLLEIVRDVLDTLFRSGERSLVDDDEVVFAEVVEQRDQPVLEQRQPVLHPGEPAPLADRFVKRVLRGIGPEHLAVPAAEPLDAVLVEQGLAGGQQQMAVEPPGGHLRIRVETAQAFQLVAEEVEPQGLVQPAREDVHDRPANGVFALVDHRVGAAVALLLEQQREAFTSDFRAGFELAYAFANAEGREDALEHGIGRGDDQLRLCFAGLQAVKRSQPFGTDRQGRTGTVVGQRIPRGKLDDVEFGREEMRRIGNRPHRSIVGRDEDGASRAGAREIGHHQRLRPAGDLRQRQRLAGFEDPGKVGHRRDSAIAFPLFPSTRNVDVIEQLHLRHQRALEADRRFLRIQRPGHDIDVVFLEQSLEPAEFFFAPAFVIPIVKAADHVVGFARAAVPGTETGALLAAFECQGFNHGWGG